jgi:ABC-2 type transport system ATP-binding protein
MPAIVCSGLSKRYGKITALSDLDMTVPEGSIFGFLGPNGAGKSTAIRILATLGRPDAGDAMVAGASVARDPAGVPRALGYLPQVASFPGWMNGQEYLEFAAALSGVPARERRARAVAVLERVGLADAARRRIGGYSGGMRQRLGIGQALIHRPPVLILDEPVSALDPLGRRDVIELIAGLRGQATVFFSSHILDDIDRVCDRVAILAAGKLIAQESMAGLKERYAQPVFIITVDGEAEALAASLAGEPWVVDATTSGSHLRVLARDAARAERELPRLVLDSGLTLLRYEQSLPSLEDVFVKLVAPGHGAAA